MVACGVHLRTAIAQLSEEISQTTFGGVRVLLAADRAGTRELGNRFPK
jgi:hypothetical protein